MKKTDLIQKVKQLGGITQDERAYLINLVNTKKKYGLVWEDKPEDVEEQLRENLPVLKEVKERAIINGEEYPNHILIEGDNLHALTALTFTHEGKIDVIYIDPPYNTGNKDFKYNDTFVDKEDSYRHSKWLSFMSKRLEISKRLLSDTGIIFVSIDDNEQANLKLLLDDVFGEMNFVSSVPRVAKRTSDKGTHFRPTKDYLLVYAKSIQLLPEFGVAKRINESDYDLVEADGRKYKQSGASLFQPSLDSRPNQRYYIQAPDGSLIIPPGTVFPSEKKDGAKIKPLSNSDKVWRWSVETYEKQKHLLMFTKGSAKNPLLDENGNQSKWNIYPKVYLDDDKEATLHPEDIIYDYPNSQGTKELISLGISFTFSKPTGLIKYLLSLVREDNITILDFFAGSGTTLHATMQLNSEDGGSRQCILVTNNENNICEEVTYERNKRVIEGYTNAKGEKVYGLANNNLRYYKSEFVGREPSIKNKKEITRLATELLCIKEDIYNEQKQIGGYQLNATYVRCFQQGPLYLLVIYDEDVIEQVVEVIQSVVTADAERNTHLKVYVFSNGQYPYTEEFEEVLPYITLCALPDAIYKAYQNVLPKRQRQQVPELEESTAEDVETSLQDEANPNLFNQAR